MSLDIWLTIEIDTGNKPEEMNLYSANYTSNVTPMWDKAGVYDALYNSEGKLAGELIEVLKAGIHDMVDNPKEYKKLNPANGWGDYNSALGFLIDFYKACENYPKAKVGTSS